MVNVEKHRKLIKKLNEDNPEIIKGSITLLINSNPTLLANELAKDLEENLPVLRQLKLVPESVVRNSGLANMKDSLLVANTVLEVIENDKDSLTVTEEEIEELKYISTNFVEVANEILKTQEEHLAIVPNKIKEIVENT